MGGEAREFPRTRWTLILSSREGLESRQKVLQELLQTYWKPLYFYARRKGIRIDDAKDAVQGFFARLLEQDFLGRLTPEKGRFRSYLRAGFDHYLINLHESEYAKKRGGNASVVRLDFEVAERDLAESPEESRSAYDREWALNVMERAIEQLREEFRAGHRGGTFEVFLEFFKPADRPSYRQAADACGLTIPQLKSFLHRTRARFRELVLEEIGHTVSHPREAEEEVSELLQALRG